MKWSHTPLLLTPGPLNIPLRVRQAMEGELGSRTPEFTRVYSQICQRIQSWVGHGDFVAQVIPGSATEVIERMIRNFSKPEESVLIFENGIYGRRLVQIAQKWFHKVEVISGDPFKALSVDAVLRRRDLSQFRWAMLVHCETSSGILNPIKPICQKLQAEGIEVLVDAVSSFPFCEIPWDFLSCAVSTSGKWLWGPPGLGLGFIHSRLWERPAPPDCPTTWDLRLQKEHIQATGQFRFTPPLPLFLGLSCAVDLLQEEGLETRWKRQLQLSQQLEDILHKLKLHSLGEESYLIPGLRNVLLPEGLSWETLFETLRSEGLFLYPASLNPESAFRVCTWGEIQFGDLVLFEKSFLRLISQLS